MPVLSARTVYIDNQSGHAYVMDRAYNQLQKWGGFQVVDDPAKADLVLKFTAKETEGGTDTVSTYNYSTHQWNYSTVNEDSTLAIHFFVVKPTDGTILWSMAFGPTGAIKEFRKRIEEQENAGRYRITT